MSKSKHPLDEFVRRKLETQSPDYDEQHWLAAREMLREAGVASRPVAWWQRPLWRWLALSLFLVLGTVAGVWWASGEKAADEPMAAKSEADGGRAYETEKREAASYAETLRPDSGNDEVSRATAIDSFRNFSGSEVATKSPKEITHNPRGDGQRAGATSKNKLSVPSSGFEKPYPDHPVSVSRASEEMSLAGQTKSETGADAENTAFASPSLSPEVGEPSMVNAGRTEGEPSFEKPQSSPPEVQEEKPALSPRPAANHAADFPERVSGDSVSWNEDPIAPVLDEQAVVRVRTEAISFPINRVGFSPGKIPAARPLFIDPTAGSAAKRGRHRVGVRAGGLGQIETQPESNNLQVGAYRPWAGLSYRYALSLKWSLFSGLNWISRRGGNARLSLRSISYDFGFRETITRVTPGRVHFLEVPLDFSYRVAPRHAIFVGASVARTLAAQLSLQTTVRTDFATRVEPATEAYGYRRAYEPFSAALRLGYRYELGAGWRLGSLLSYGLTDVTDDAFWRQNRTERNLSLRLWLTYDLFAF